MIASATKIIRTVAETMLVISAPLLADSSNLNFRDDRKNFGRLAFTALNRGSPYQSVEIVRMDTQQSCGLGITSAGFLKRP